MGFLLLMDDLRASFFSKQTHLQVPMMNSTATYSRSRTLEVELFLTQTVPRLFYFIPHLSFCILVVGRLFHLLSPYVYVSLEWALRKLMALVRVLIAQAKLFGSGDVIPDYSSSSSVYLVGRQGGAFRRESTSRPISYVSNTHGLTPVGRPAGGGQRGSYEVRDELAEDDRKQFKALKVRVVLLYIISKSLTLHLAKAYVHKLISSGNYIDQRITWYKQDKKAIKGLVDQVPHLPFFFLSGLVCWLFVGDSEIPILRKLWKAVAREEHYRDTLKENSHKMKRNSLIRWQVRCSLLNASVVER